MLKDLGIVLGLGFSVMFVIFLIVIPIVLVVHDSLKNRRRRNRFRTTLQQVRVYQPRRRARHSHDEFFKVIEEIFQ